ncbi:MAG: U32 family peptidase [Methanoregulaceae archaeon]|jgi:putative protease
MHQEHPDIPELLAPAGSMDALIAAVNAGADAVYIGGKRFGARKYSANFTDAEIGEAVTYAHLRGARVYVAVNTLVHDRELPDVAAYLNDLYALGADAVLIQDPGVAAIARDVVPDLPRHASTQYTIASPEGVVFAKQEGYDRAVLAREQSLGGIDRIFALPARDRPGIEIFIHGALCYSYSGQCLLSSVIGGRSGNRGACAQPCRRDYTLVAGTADQYGRIADPSPLPLPEHYLLSTKDLCTYSLLAEFVKRPLAALKIEGRMRSPDYVAVVVSIYRKALDAAAAGTFVPDPRDREDLATAFSRGFTGGYLFGDRGPVLMGRDRPDNRGLFIGTIRSCSEQETRVTVASDTVPAQGDGLVGIDPRDQKESGFVILNPPVRVGPGLVIRQQTGCRPGMALYLTRSARLERTAAAIRRAPGPAGRFPVPIDLSLTVAPGIPPVLTGTFRLPGREPVTVREDAAFIPEPAGTRPTSSEEVTRQIRKAGGTAFRVCDLEVTYDGGLFIPVGQLNQFRRQFFIAAERALLALSLPAADRRMEAEQRLAALLPALSRKGTRSSRIPELAIFCNEVESVTAAVRSGCHRVFFEPDPAGMGSDLPWAIAECREAKVQFAWKWPRVPVPEFTRKAYHLLPALRDTGLGEVMVEGAMYAGPVRAIAPGIRVTGGPDLNIFNARAAIAMAPHCPGVTLSPELSGDDIADLCSRLGDQGWISVIVQGNIPAMVTADALLDLVANRKGPGQFSFGLADTTGRIFPVHPDPWGRSHILNAAELCLLDYLPRLARAGVDAVVIDARWRGPGYAAAMVSLYREAMDHAGWIAGDERMPDQVVALKERVRSMAQGGITAGHFIRGLSPD